VVQQRHNEMDELRVLIVDDSPTEALALSSVLQANGFTALIAHSAEDGIAMADREVPDVILMDIVMPGMNGFQATRQLGRQPRTATIPVIVVSTKNLETDRIWALRQGARDYVVKPVEELALLRAIQGVLATPTN
jgi:twitching motility two-component system response regulator PilH